MMRHFSGSFSSPVYRQGPQAGSNGRRFLRHRNGIIHACFLQKCHKDGPQRIRPAHQHRLALGPPLVQSIRSYVDKNCGQIASVTQIATHHYYSREYVSRLFKKYYNIPLSRYLTDRKLDLACSLLEQGKSISFAFDSSGFHSMSAFIQAFRQRTGLTPSQYRSKLSENQHTDKGESP